MFDVTAPPVPQAGGAKIVFASNRDGFRQIYVMNADGSSQTRLTTDGSNNDNPRWSPNGAKILFQSDRDNPETGNYDIYVMNADGSGQTRLTTDANDDCAGVWSSDGTKIVFQSLRNGVNYQIYVMNADGTGQANISNNGANDIGASWSSDGLRIAFASDRDQPGFSSIYVMNANGSSQTRLTLSGTGLRDEQPVWSPDRTKIVFTSTRDSLLESWQETDDYEIPEDDGQIITKSRLNINKEVYVMNTDGSGQTRLTNTLENDDSPCWSPDGTKIVFRSDRERDWTDPTQQIWTMNPEGSGQTLLSNNPFDDFSPSWTSSSNQPPVANAGGPYSGIAGQVVSFNAGGSLDSDGTITNYTWNFGDGGSGSGVAPTHAYTSAGTYTVTLTVTDNLGATNSATATVTVSASAADQYTQNFYQWAVVRQPNAEETNYWMDMLRAAYAHGQGSMALATREMGKTIFESAEYAARNRSDHWYVYDLYKSYLMREPDAQGWAYWDATVPLYGREHVRRGFDESTEFQNLVATITPTGSPSAAVTSLATARVDPFNQSGNQLQARDAEWGVNLISLPGRAGLDLGLGLSYSSLVWTRSGPYTYFDADTSGVSPGFHIGFPTIQEKYFDAKVGTNVYLLKTAAGRKVELRQVGTSNVYEAADSTYLQLIASGSLLLRSTDGTQMTFTWVGINEYRCTEIKDRNGNYIVVNYDWRGDIQNVTDTVGRVITFNYDSNANLSSITQTWNGQTPPHTWATFGWENLTMQPTVSGVVGTYSGEIIPVLKMVGFADGSSYSFAYLGTGQVRTIARAASDTWNHSYTIYEYDSPTADCPRLTQMRTWATNWSDQNGVPHEVATYFGVQGDAHVLTAPDGTVYKERYAVPTPVGAAPAWQKGLLLESEVWSAGVQQKVSTVQWTQDNTNVVYQTNPRIVETNVYDSSGNRRRATIDYSVAAYAQYGLPYFVTEYAANGVTELRRTYRDYNLSQPYLDRRIIGLVSARHLVNQQTGQYEAQVTYGYDDPARLTSQATNATMHDQNYHSTFTTRGNLTSASRWDVTDINNASKALTSYLNYNAAGSVVSTADAAGHTNSVSYTDAFSANGTSLDAPRSFATFAYPTSVTDADGFSSTVWYRYDFGAKTRLEGPPPQDQPNGMIQTFSYDAAARIERVTTVNNGAYTRYLYGPDYIESFSSVNNVADEAYTFQLLNGQGQVFLTGSNHPGSVGEYKAQVTYYDVMGRVMKQSNPTEINNAWSPAGDDAAGWVSTQQTYDWQGRPWRRIHPDGYYTEATYAGCGCAGGEVVTLTDEVGRQQKVYSDVMGRQWKNEVLNWDSTVYSSVTNTFNARDQVTLVRQWAGAENSGAYQETTMAYDGYGRLQSKHVPEQNAGTATVYAYNSDDTIQSVTDARGVTASFGYNARHLMTSIIYPVAQSLPSGVSPSANVSYGYDAAGNRTLMTDGMGSVSSGYNQLSRMTSETRTFTGVGSFTLGYDYNLAGQLKKITDPTNMTINYGFDSRGRLSAVAGSDNLFNGVSNYASNHQYRAWGGLKQRNLGNGVITNLGYNARLQVATYELRKPDNQLTVATTHQYYADGRFKFSQGLADQFDRVATYDHAGRLSEAYSGSEARDLINSTQSGSPTGPYRQTYQFDSFDNMTGRNNRFWSQSENYTTTYADNRNQNTGWHYNAEGDVTQNETNAFTYDAAGHVYEMSDGVGNIVQFFDGDGEVAKKVTNGLGGIPIISYFVRSSVMGGAIIAELSSTGIKQKGYVYGDAELLAIQFNGNVQWQHKNPITGSHYDSPPSGLIYAASEPEPMGVNMGLGDPYQMEPPPTPDPDIPSIKGDSGNVGPPQRCTLDGSEFSCAQLRLLMEAGATSTQIWVRDNRGLHPEELPVVPLGMGNFGVDYPVAKYDDEGPYWGSRIEAFHFDPQNSSFKLHGPGFTDKQMGLLVDALIRIKEDDCKNFINETLAKYKVGEGSNSLDKLLNRATLGYYDVNANYTNTDLGVDMRSTILLMDDFVNRSASAATAGPHIFLSDKVFERSSSIFPIERWNRKADTPSYIVHELFHVAGIDKSIIDSQQMSDAIRRNCRLIGSDRIIIRH